MTAIIWKRTPDGILCRAFCAACRCFFKKRPPLLLTFAMKSNDNGLCNYKSSLKWDIRSSAVPCGRKRKKHKIATHKRKKKLRMMRHKKK